MLKVGLKIYSKKMRKLLIVGSSVAAGIVGLTGLASAQVVIPTSTVASLQTVAGAQISDPGTLLILSLVLGLPLAFWLIHKFIGMIPKSHGSKRA